MPRARNIDLEIREALDNAEAENVIDKFISDLADRSNDFRPSAAGSINREFENRWCADSLFGHRYERTTREHNFGF